MSWGFQKMTEIKPLQPTDVRFIVGQITDIKQHPNADKLFIEQVNLGDKTIQILSGLVPYYKAEELLNKKIFVVENLKPAKMRGEMSYGMLLAAETENEQSIVEVLDATNFEIGQTFSDTSKEQIEFGEFITLKITVDKNKVFINGEPFLIGDKQLTTDKVTTGQVH